MNFSRTLAFALAFVAFAFNSTEAVFKGWKADRTHGGRISRHMVHFRSVGCGGVLIAWDTVLTAAHCPIEVGETAFIGTVDRNDVSRAGIQMTVVESVAHPRYGMDTSRFDSRKGATLAGASQHDIRVLTVAGASSSQMQATGVAPVAIDWNSYLWYPGKTTKLRIAGFGASTVKCNIETRLQLGDAYSTKCEKYPENFPGANSRLQFCIDGSKGGQTTCRGDSGGPVFRKKENQFVLVGLVSGGEFAAEKCCVPREKWHAVNVAGYRSWISSLMSAQCFPMI